MTTSPPPTRERPTQKAKEKPRCQDGDRHNMGSQEAAAEEGKALSFVRVTHPPAPPGRRVLHFELPAQGRRAAIFPRTQLVPSGAAHGSADLALAPSGPRHGSLAGWRAPLPPSAPNPAGPTNEEKKPILSRPRPTSAELSRRQNTIDAFSGNSNWLRMEMTRQVKRWGGFARGDGHGPQARPQPKHEATGLQKKAQGLELSHPLRTGNLGSRTS